ncbi:MAG: NUDIX hydrolase [Bacteroidaceae bacterium]|nr:NUDIX hydrolase [Bacteroidaceae bacterium]
MAPLYYSQNPKFLVAVDCIIFGFQRGELKVLLQQRPFEPHKGEWSLMGGFVQENENLDDAANRVLTELTGLEDIYMRQIGTFGGVHRDSGDRVISVAYMALLDIDKVDDKLNRQNASRWENIDEVPHLLFDHNQMVALAHRRLRESIPTRPVGFQMLPPLFTLTQLQNLYEAVLGETLDKRNFRKRIGEMKFIEKTDQIDKLSSRRGAALYRFNYQHFVNGEQPFKL